MPLTTRLTPSGRQKQLRDELAAWTTLKNNAFNTPSYGQIHGTATWDIAGQATAIDTTTDAYRDWKDAHKNATKRARIDRQREQQAAATLGPHPNPVLPCRVSHAVNVRDTIRVAVLQVRTSEDRGGGTMLTPGSTAKATLPQLYAYLDDTLDKIETALRDAGAHRDEADLRAASRPPVQVLLSSEWYFRLPNRPFTQTERDAIEARLIVLSRKYPEWVLVPGSIYWSPDPQTSATIRVYNQALVLFAGSVICTRTKRESHDIDSDLGVRSKERWGPDWPTVNPPAAHPAAVPAATFDAAIFNLKGRDYCVEICRDQWVGDAVDGYFNHGANNTGADIYLFMSNGTQWQDEFAPARNNAIAVWCDGSGVGSHQYSRMTRLAALNANMVPFNNFRAAFVVDRAHDALSSHGFNNAQLIERANAPVFQNFMARYDRVFATSLVDVPIYTAADTFVLAHPAAVGVVKQYYDKGLRIQSVLMGGELPTGTPISPEENALMTQYAAALVQFGAEDIALSAHKPTTDGLKVLAKASLAATKAALTPGMVNIPNVADLHLYELVDL